MSYENPKSKITAVPATDEEIWGATFKVVTNFHIQLGYKFVFCSRSFSMVSPLAYDVLNIASVLSY